MNANVDAPVAGVPRPNWWKRNWKWFLPLICVLFVAEIAGFVAFLSGWMKTSEPYKEAVQRTREAPAVVNAIGSPIKESFWIAGNVRITNDRGSASFRIPIEGPNGRAVVTVAAKRTRGIWHLTQLIVVIAGTGERFDLLKDSPTGESVWSDFSKRYLATDEAQAEAARRFAEVRRGA